MPLESLTSTQIESALHGLPGWVYDDHALRRTVSFDQYLWGISCVNALAHLAERQNHHPDIAIHYTQITVSYWTHTRDDVTQADVTGAQEAERILQQFLKSAPGINATPAD